MKDANVMKMQSGVALLEAMIAILVISFGILGIIGLQANAINMTTDARYRVDAGALADRIIAEMWVNPANIAGYAWAGAGAPPPAIAAWVNNIQNPNSPTYLPGSATYPPLIDIQADNTVSVTVRWKLPQAPAADPEHRYVALTNINSDPEL